MSPAKAFYISVSHLKIRPETIPILMKDLFLNLFEPSRCKETSGFRKFEVIRTKVTAMMGLGDKLETVTIFQMSSNITEPVTLANKNSVFKKLQSLEFIS